MKIGSIRYTREPLTDDQKQFIKENFQTMIYLDIAKALSTTERRVANYIQKSGLRLSPEEYHRRRCIGTFKPGHTSWNKGLSLPNKPNSGQFKKGSVPGNILYDGAVVFRKRKKRVNQDYYFIRVAKNKWIPYHVYLWEQTHGSIPKGSVVRFKDGDHKNVALENLEMITRKKNLVLNSPEVRPDRIIYDRYVAARIGIKGKENQDWYIKNHPEIIEAKRQQLKLGRVLNETKRQNFQHAKQNLDVQFQTPQNN